MGLTLADSYYLKAKAATRGLFSDWEEVCEALNYALSYDEEHCPSLCLLGEIYAKHLSMPEKAFDCFDKVIAIDTNYEEVYYKYIKYLIWNAETDRAKTLIDFAKTIENISKADIYWLSSYLEETQENYKTCLTHLKAAKRHCYNDYFFDVLNDEQKRIQKKQRLDKKKKTSKKRTKAKKKKNRSKK